MKNKKKYILFSIFFIVIFSLSIFITRSLHNKENINLSDESKVIKDEYLLSMMLEQNSGAGDYVMTTASTWPTEGYVFNSTLSKCENGGEVAWDSDNNTVLMMGNTSDKCYIYFDKYSLIKINNYNITSSGNSIIITINANSGTGAISKYYYSKDGGVNYIESTSDTYTFTGLSKGTYNVKAYVLDSNNKSSSTISKSIEITTIPFATYIKSLYTGVQGENGLYYHDGNLTNGIDDNSYRYAGASDQVNNYVCFGSTDATCPTDNLYRIIGVFEEQVKIIKFTSIGSMGWDSNNSNIWSTASLNTYLNGTYLTSLGDYANKIAQTTWKVGGNSWTNIGTVVPATVYQNEVGTSSSNTTYDGQIGLMYVSDYLYAAASDAWSKVGYSDSGSSYDYRSTTGINWLYLGSTEWTISPNSDTRYPVFHVDSDGSVHADYYGADDSRATRPSFYLNSSVLYISGDGSASSPHRIN